MSDALGDGFGGEARDKHDELVAAHAGDIVGVAAGFFEESGEFLEDAIAFEVAESIID